MSIYAITRSEWSVLHCLANGLSANETAEKLCIERTTVSVYASNIRRKLGMDRPPNNHYSDIISWYCDTVPFEYTWDT